MGDIFTPKPGQKGRRARGAHAGSDFGARCRSEQGQSPGQIKDVLEKAAKANLGPIERKSWSAQ